MDSSKLNPEDQQAALSQYSTTGTVEDKYVTRQPNNQTGFGMPPAAVDKEKEAENAKYWEGKAKAEATRPDPHPHPHLSSSPFILTLTLIGG